MVGSGIGDPKTETLGADTHTSNNAKMKTAIAPRVWFSSLFADLS